MAESRHSAVRMLTSRYSLKADGQFCTPKSMPLRRTPMNPAYKTSIFLVLLVSFADASACSVPKRGIGWSADELIEHSQSIVLAVLSSKVTDDSSVITTHLEVVEVIKGEALKSVVFFSFSMAHHSNGFTGHADEEFWEENVGRSPFPCCICGPDHTFVEGETYLLFPDGFGAMKSAEIVDVPDDKWLQYVRESLETD